MHIHSYFLKMNSETMLDFRKNCDGTGSSVFPVAELFAVLFDELRLEN